jgi:phage-related protein
MSRKKRARGEKPLFWIASSLEDLLAFPEGVQDEIGSALSVAQFGGKHPSAKPWKGTGPGIFEIEEDHRGDAYRAIYTIRYANAVYVLRAFQKKSRSEIRTPKRDVDLIAQRLKLAQQDYEERHEN